MRKTLSWKAVRSGRIYCAPACGRGCTWAEYQKANSDAKALAKKLRNVDTDVSGPWSIVVHENMGWHWHITKGLVTLHAYESGHLAAYLNAAGPWGGNLIAVGKKGSSGGALVRQLLDTARKQIAPMLTLAEHIGATP